MTSATLISDEDLIAYLDAALPASSEGIQYRAKNEVDTHVSR